MTTPPYVERALSAGGAQPRFMHLGLWEDPERAGVSQDELHAAQARLNDRLLAMGDLRDGGRVVDVGCGLGGTLAVLNARLRRSTLTGVNVDPRQLDVARGVQPANDNQLSFFVADACALPLADASVDRVLCIEAMFHFSSRRRFFQEAARVLAPGGRLVVSDLLARAPTAGGVPATAIEQRVLGGARPWPDLFCADADLTALADTAALDVLDLVDATAETRPSWACFGVHASATSPTTDPVEASTETLAWLHETGYLRVMLGSFERRAA